MTNLRVLNYTQAAPHAFDFPEWSALFEAEARRYHDRHGEPYDPVRLVQLHHFLKEAYTLSPGHYLELGVHQGLTLRFIYQFMDHTYHLYGLDTFEGFDPRDITAEHEAFPGRPYGRMDFKPTSMEDVANYVTGPVEALNFTLIQGWFPDAFQGFRDRPWRFVHIDFDLYEPIRAALEILWPQMVPGGFIVVHDYGNIGFPGPKKALDEFCLDYNIWPVELPDRWGSAVIRKIPKGYGG